MQDCHDAWCRLNNSRASHTSWENRGDQPQVYFHNQNPAAVSTDRVTLCPESMMALDGTWMTLGWHLDGTWMSWIVACFPAVTARAPIRASPETRPASAMALGIANKPGAVSPHWDGWSTWCWILDGNRAIDGSRLGKSLRCLGCRRFPGVHLVTSGCRLRVAAVGDVRLSQQA